MFKESYFSFEDGLGMEAKLNQIKQQTLNTIVNYIYLEKGI